MAEPFFTKRWIDAQLAEGKRGGAFCAGVTPDLHPYVLMNYTGRPRDVMTLAHELGHGVHDVLASDNHLLDYRPVLPLAETASTFAEMLVFDSLMAALETPRERLALVCGKVEDTFATVFRQVAMFRFAQVAHQARRERGDLHVRAVQGRAVLLARLPDGALEAAQGRVQAPPRGGHRRQGRRRQGHCGGGKRQRRYRR